MENLKDYSQIFIIIIVANFVLNLFKEGLEMINSEIKKVMNKTESNLDNKIFKVINVVLKILKVVTYLLQKFIKFSQGNFKISGAKK